jgi:hypothetical protein
MSTASPRPVERERHDHQAASVADAAPSGLRARLRRATQQLLDQLDEHWDNNDTLAHSWPTCC